MKKILILMSILSFSFLVYAQKDTLAKTTIRPMMVAKIIPSQRTFIIRKDVVKLKTQLVLLNDSISVTKTEIDTIVDKMKTDLNSMNEMGEMESLRLQMAMNRLSKMMSMMSNMLKQMSNTAQAIIQNMK